MFILLIRLLYVLLFAALSLGQGESLSLLSRENPLYVHDVIVIIMLLAWLSWKTFNFPQTKVSLQKPIVAIFLIMNLSLLVNSYRYAPEQLLLAFAYQWRWFSYALIYFMTADFMKIRILSRQFISVCLLGFSSVIAISGLIQYLLYPDLRNLFYLGWDPHANRLFSTLLDPNFSGIMLVLGLFLSLSLLESKRRLSLIGGIVIISTHLASLMLTYSRSSYVAFIFGLIVLTTRRSMTSTILLIGGFTLLLSILPRSSSEGTTFQRTASVQARLATSLTAMKFFIQNPIIGIGYNGYRYVIGDRNQQSSTFHSGSGIDNSFLFFLATTGCFGFVMLFWLLKTMLTTARHLVAPWHFVLTASLIAVCVHSLIVNSLFYPWVLIWLWVEWALGETIGSKLQSDLQ